MNSRLKVFLKKCLFFPGFLVNAPYYVLHGVNIPQGLECIGISYIRNKGRIELGRNVRIRSGFRSNPIGLGCKTVLRTFKNGHILIGNHVKMSNVSICSAKRIYIGNEVMIGGGVCIYDTDFHSTNPYIRMELVP